MTPDQAKKYYRNQRIVDEEKAYGGSDTAQAEVRKIYGKLGRPVPDDISGKPGASEGEQMANVATIGGGLGDAVPALVRGLFPRAAETLALGAGRRTIPRLATAEVRGAAKVRPQGGSVQKALPGGKAAPKVEAAKAGPGRGNVAPKESARVNPRAAGTSMRQRGISPRQVAKQKAEEAAAPKGRGKIADRVKQKLSAPQDDFAHRGYLVKRGLGGKEWHVSKGGHHITTQKSAGAAKKAIEEITG